MSDLVKRLREAARTGKPGCWNMLATSELNAAADRIEELEAQLPLPAKVELMDAVEELTFELEQVRAATAPERQQFAVVAVTECGAVSMTFLENALMRPGTYPLYL